MTRDSKYRYIYDTVHSVYYDLFECTRSTRNRILMVDVIHDKDVVISIGDIVMDANEVMAIAIPQLQYRILEFEHMHNINSRFDDGKVSHQILHQSLSNNNNCSRLWEHIDMYRQRADAWIDFNTEDTSKIGYEAYDMLAKFFLDECSVDISVQVTYHDRATYVIRVPVYGFRRLHSYTLHIQRIIEYMLYMSAYVLKCLYCDRHILQTPLIYPVRVIHGIRGYMSDHHNHYDVCSTCTCTRLETKVDLSVECMICMVATDVFIDIYITTCCKHKYICIRCIQQLNGLVHSRQYVESPDDIPCPFCRQVLTYHSAY